MKKTKSILLPISLYYAIRFMSLSALGNYMGVYYGALNYNTSQIAFIDTIIGIVILFAQPFWGIRSDRATKKNTILYICLIASTVLVWLVPLSGKVLIFMAISLALFNFFQCAVNPISDAMTLELSSERGYKFSHIRTIGSLGFAIMSAITGMIFNKNIYFMFPIFSLLMFVSLLLALLYPPIEGHQSKSKQKVKIVELFKDKRLVILYSFAFVISITFGLFNSFHSFYSKSVGISTAVLGLGVSLGSFSQFPFMIFFDKIYKKFGILNILLLSGIVSALRWMIYATALNEVTFFIAWGLHGCTFIVFYLCMAQFVSDTVVKELKASGQMMNAIIISGLSKVVSPLFGGILAAYIGLDGAFLIGSILCIIAVAILFIVSKTTDIFKESQPQILKNVGSL